MFWISVLIFLTVLLSLLAGYLLLGPKMTKKMDLRKRLSLLELRTLQREDLPDVLKSELLSDVPFLNRLLVHFNVAVQLDKQLKQANLDMKVGTFVLLSFILFALGLLGGTLWRYPSPISIFFGGVLLLIPMFVVKLKKNNRTKRFTLYFPEALEMFSRSLRAGHSFTGAIQLVGQEMPDPVGPEFEKVFDEQNLGISLRTALIGLTNRIDILDLRFFVTAILIQRETGGNLAEIIDKIAHVIRERFRVQGQLKIHTAQARLTGTVLAFLPIAVACILFFMSPGYMKTLWTEPAGRSMIAGALVLQVVGMMVIRKIIRIKI